MFSLGDSHIYYLSREATDMRNLSEENIRTYFDEHLWISINRQKTGVQSNIVNIR